MSAQQGTELPQPVGIVDDPVHPDDADYIQVKAILGNTRYDVFVTVGDKHSEHSINLKESQITILIDALKNHQDFLKRVEGR